MFKAKTLVFLFLLFGAFALFVATRNSVRTLETNQTISEAGKIPEKVSENKAAAVSNDQTETNEKLQTEADALLHLFDDMASVPIHLANEPIIKSGSNVEKGVAYTICRDKKNPVIIVKKKFYEKSNRKQLVNILKHEMTHAWFCRQGLSAEHDARFRKKFESVGGFGN